MQAHIMHLNKKKKLQYAITYFITFIIEIIKIVTENSIYYINALFFFFLNVYYFIYLFLLLLVLFYRFSHLQGLLFLWFICVIQYINAVMRKYAKQNKTN